MRFKKTGAVANSADNTMMKKRQGCLEHNSAYTLIEVMLVLAIVSVVLIAAQRT